MKKRKRKKEKRKRKREMGGQHDHCERREERGGKVKKKEQDRG